MELFQSNIETISNSSSLDLEVPDGLFSYAEFRAIWEKPEQFREAALRYITNPEHPERNRLIAAYAVQKLPVDEYFSFCEGIYEAYRSGTVNEPILQKAMFPVYNFDTKTVDNYARSDFNDLLVKVRMELERRGQATLVKRVDGVLSGKAAQDVKRLRDMGQLPPTGG